MNHWLRKISAISMVFLILFATILTILAIWEIIEIEHIFRKTIGTLLILLLSTAILLFVLSIVIGEPQNEQKSNETSPPADKPSKASAINDSLK